MKNFPRNPIEFNTLVVGVVERTHSWMNRFRGILIRWNIKADNYIGMLHLVLGLITLRAIGLSG